MLDEKMNWFSVSKINTFNSCSMKYKFNYIDKIKKKTSFALVRGSVVHKIIQKHILEYFESGVLIETISPLEVAKEFILEIISRVIYDFKSEGDYSDYSFKKAFNLIVENDLQENYRSIKAEMKEEIKNHFKTYESFFTQIALAIPETFEKLINLITSQGFSKIYSETKLISHVRKYGLRGYLDLSAYDAQTNKALIIEMKTSKQTSNKIKENNINQILFYKNLYRKNFKNVDLKYFIVYIAILKTKININIFDASDVENENYSEELSKNLSSINNAVKHNLYSRKYDQHCSYCDFKEKCFKKRTEENKNLDEVG